MAYRPITDIWIMARPKVSYYGAFPAGFVERARALLGVTINDPVLHVCAGRVRDYPYLERAVGPNDGTVDLDPALNPDYVMDVRELGVAEGDRFPWSEANVGAAPAHGPPMAWGTCLPLTEQAARGLARSDGYLWAGALVDRPYTEADADEYVPGSDALPDPNDLLKRSLSVVRPGGRVGFLDYYLPRPPKAVGETPIKFVACIGVIVGYGNRMRCFSVFERVAVNTLKEDRDRAKRMIDQAEPEPTEVGAGCAHPWHDNPGLITPCPSCGATHERAEDEAPLVEPTPEQHAVVHNVVNAAEARKVVCRPCWLKRKLPEPPAREPDGPAKCDDCGNKAMVMPLAEAGAVAQAPATSSNDAALDGF